MNPLGLDLNSQHNNQKLIINIGYFELVLRSLVP